MTMRTASASASVRILPTNKVYRQLFDAQVQLSEAYNRVRDNQLSEPVNIVTHPDATPLVKNIRPHESQKRQWVSSLPYDNDPSINPITIFFHDEQKRRQTEEQQELDQIKQEVFDLPDNIEEHGPIGNDSNKNKTNVTERLAVNRQNKFNQLWNELLEKIAELNQSLLKELETITRECNIYYEQGDKELDKQVQAMIYQKEITALTFQSFDDTLNYLDRFLPSRHSKIQEYCQSIEQLEMERTRKIRDLFKLYSERLYKTNHLSNKETAGRLEQQANKLNTQIIENRKIYTELEARLLSGETDRVHRYRDELVDHQNKWREDMWIISKQTWIAKLSQCKVKFDVAITSSCEPIGLSIIEHTRHFVEHVRMLNSFVPPKSTKENTQKWYKEGYDIMDTIVNKRKALIHQIKQIINDEIGYLEKQWKTIEDKVRQNQVYKNDEQIKIVFERDIEPVLEERKQLLQATVVDQAEAAYEQLTNSMYSILDRLVAFIEPPANQWDNHQVRLEHVTAQLVDLMRECRRPHDLQNEKKLTKLDATLDEMRSASNETVLNRLLKSAYDQLDIIKANFTQFYKLEHEIVNKYSDMIADEVKRYKNEMLVYFHAREVDTNDDNSLSLSDVNPQLYTTSLARTTYEIEDMNKNETDLAQNITNDIEEGDDADAQIRRRSTLDNQSPVHTFLTEDSTSADTVPFSKSFRIPSNLVESIMFNLCRAFLDYCDQWQEETTRRADAVMYSKHDELDKEMDFQMHLHEPRRTRIETDVHHVRAAELSTHDERIERHIRGVDETLEQTDTNYRLMLNDFAKSINTYKDDINGLEQLFVNATTTVRLVSLQDRLAKKRDGFMDNVRISLRSFRQQFDEAMQRLRQANANFRKSFIIFSEGGNYSREEIEMYRRKLEKTAGQIDKAETVILKEMEKLEKKQLEEATKIISQFQERFKSHMTDLKFIELANRWISDTQVKIKGEVGANNQQAQVLKKLILSYRDQIDSFLNPNVDKQKTTLTEIRDIFQQIILMNYERALYLKCLTNELIIPASVVPILKEKGVLTEEKLVNDLQNVAHTEELNTSRRSSRISIIAGNSVEEVKSVKFAPPTRTSSSRNKSTANAGTTLTTGHPEEMNTISTIRTLLHKSEQPESDEIVEPDAPTTQMSNTRSIASRSSSRSSQFKISSAKLKNNKRSSVDGSVASSTTKRHPPGRAKTRDEIFALYCTFGEKKHSNPDFLSKILNILRESIEGLLTHAELYYREKGSRPVTRPLALREKFDEYANTMIEKLKSYEEQCRAYYEHSVNEFRDMLELFERASSLLAKAELDEQTKQAEKVLDEIKQQFDMILNEKLNESDREKFRNFDQLRPTLGHPARKNDLQEIDSREKIRQNELQQVVTQLRLKIIKNIQTDAQSTINALATNAERLLIIFDDILTADEIIKTRLPEAKQPLAELVRRQQSGRPLENREPKQILERKPGHWPGVPLLDDQLNRSKAPTKKRSVGASQRQKTSASIVTQKTTLPQIETITQRDQVYQRYKAAFFQTLSDIESRCSLILTELDRYRVHWNGSIDKLQQLRTC